MFTNTPKPQGDFLGINILICPKCSGVGRVAWGNCPECHGQSMGQMSRGKWQYWDYPLERGFLTLEKWRQILNKIRLVVSFLLGLVCWGWGGFLIYLLVSSNAYLKLPLTLNFRYFFATLHSLQPMLLFFFFLGAIFFCYFWYRIIKKNEASEPVEHHDYVAGKKNNVVEEGERVTMWSDVSKMPKRKKINIAKTYSEHALRTIADAYALADTNRHKFISLEHVFLSLLKLNQISNIFIRLGVPAEVIKKHLAEKMKSAEQLIGGKIISPTIGENLPLMLFQAYEDAYLNHQENVGAVELLNSIVNISAEIQDLLLDYGITTQKLSNVIAWARVREKLYRNYKKLNKAASHHSRYGMDRAMTAVATPYLNQFSQDMTLMAHYGQFEPCVAREKEIEEIFRVIDGGQLNVILTGEHGVGKQTIISGIAERMVTDDVPSRLSDKRLVRLSISALLAGTTPAGAIERLRNIMYEIAHARNIILYIHNIHELIGVSTGEGKGSLDVADTLAEFLNSHRFLTIADTTNEFYSQLITNTSLSNVFTKVQIIEMEENQAIQAVESKVGFVEYKQKVFFSYSAIEKAVKLASKFVHESLLPSSAIEVITEAASLTHSQKGINTLVGDEEVAQVVSQKTKIPVTAVSSDESAKLLNLEKEMHQRVIGQDEAVDSVANALRRARADIRSTSRPIANFLFLGPTGVGKTELAKTIATVYFGGEERMIRLDMSEYQDKSGIYRLIGAPGEKGTGILTEAIRRSPFALLLLDEIEKADPNILNIFLQVMDDGRLTDSAGHVVDFTNIIIIATSNAGTSYVQEQMRAGLSSEAIKERLLHGELKQNFRPEFLNRFDGIVLFKALSREDIKKIAGLMLASVSKNLEAKGVYMQVEDVALDFLADIGFDPEFGARPMRRALQERVENKLAELTLSGRLNRKDTVVIGKDGVISVI